VHQLVNEKLDDDDDNDNNNNNNNNLTQLFMTDTTNICSHITSHRCILMDYFNNCNFSKLKLMLSLMMVWLHRNMSELL